jgi:hypothetical protein
MKLRTGVAHVLRFTGLIQSIKEPHDTRHQTLINSSGPAIVPEFSQRLATERLDHIK